MSDLNDHESEIPFISRQRPSFVLPQSGSPDLEDPLAEKAQIRVRFTDEKLAEIANGERPVLSGESKGGKWLAGQLTEMSRHGFLPQEPSAYYTLREHHKIMGHRPTSHYLIQEKDALLDAVGTAAFRCRIAGTGNALRSKGQIERLQDDASMIVALPGDLNSLQEMVALIDRKLNGQMIDQPLIIENPAHGNEEHFWDEILRSLKILDKNTRVGVEPLDRRAYVDLEALAHYYGIYVTEDRNDTIALVRHFDQSLPKNDNISVQAPSIPEGAIFFMVTGTMKKYDEISRMVAKSGSRIGLQDIFELLDIYVSPKELSGTYEGNVAKKSILH